jgi:hypothetical protein
MHLAIAITLLFASITSGLGVSRQVHGFNHTQNKMFLSAAIFAGCMMIWFAYAAVWVFQHDL